MTETEHLEEQLQCALRKVHELELDQEIANVHIEAAVDNKDLPAFEECHAQKVLLTEELADVIISVAGYELVIAGKRYEAADKALWKIKSQHDQECAKIPDENAWKDGRLSEELKEKIIRLKKELGLASRKRKLLDDSLMDAFSRFDDLRREKGLSTPALFVGPEGEMTDFLSLIRTF